MFDRADVIIITKIEDASMRCQHNDVHYAGKTRPELDIDLQSYNALHELRVSAELELPLATQLLYSELLRKVSIRVT